MQINLFYYFNDLSENLNTSNCIIKKMGKPLTKTIINKYV